MVRFDGKWRGPSYAPIWTKSIFAIKVISYSDENLQLIEFLFNEVYFYYYRLSLYVPWNEVMVLSPVKLSGKEVHVQVPELYQNIPTCLEHNYDTMQPIALATWQTSYNGKSSRMSAILAESQVVQESLEIPGSDIHLMYHSSRAKGYYSTIQLQLTPEVLPETLVRVHLVISIEGVQEERVFEADPNIKYTYAWDRLNIYRQRVYGVTTATIKVNYTQFI